VEREALLAAGQLEELLPLGPDLLEALLPLLVDLQTLVRVPLLPVEGLLEEAMQPLLGVRLAEVQRLLVDPPERARLRLDQPKLVEKLAEGKDVKAAKRMSQSTGGRSFRLPKEFLITSTL
jgi:hypothetical protein